MSELGRSRGRAETEITRLPELELYGEPQIFKARFKTVRVCNGGIGSLAHVVSKLLINSSMRTRVGLLVCKVFFL